MRKTAQAAPAGLLVIILCALLNACDEGNVFGVVESQNLSYGLAAVHLAPLKWNYLVTDPDARIFRRSDLQIYAIYPTGAIQYIDPYSRQVEIYISDENADNYVGNEYTFYSIGQKPITVWYRNQSASYEAWAIDDFVGGGGGSGSGGQGGTGIDIIFGF
ncbi:MAG: hypothetical protein LBR16_08945 [Treponema sp.]|jgi:hypothetical protein|nr:hypothetical protein [Treponema sp.]